MTKARGHLSSSIGLDHKLEQWDERIALAEFSYTITRH